MKERTVKAESVVPAVSILVKFYTDNDDILFQD